MTQIVVASQNINLETASRADFILCLTQLHTENTQLREQLAETTSELFWIETILANPNLNGNQCRVLNAAKQLTNHSKREDGFTRIYRDDVAHRAGVSVQTVSSTLTKFEKQGIIGRKLERREGEGFASELFITLPVQVLRNPGGIGLFPADEQENTWGGRRVKLCPSCRSDDLEEKHYYVCRGCGAATHPDQLLEVEESTLAIEAYPVGPITTMIIKGIYAPKRDCFVCQQREWMPAWVHDDWEFLCASQRCHPHLIESAGRDLTPGIMLGGS